MISKSLDTFLDRGSKAHQIHHNDLHECYYKAGDIVHAYLGCNIGSETDGKEYYIRPVLILRKVGNVFWCLAMTSKGKESIFQTQVHENSFVILSSLMTLDKKRFIRVKSRITQQQLQLIKKAISDLSLG